MIQVRKVLILGLLIGVTCVMSALNAHAQNGLYEFKKTGKIILNITQEVQSDSPNINFGFQSYATHEIKSAASFYNQPSDILHYVLTTKAGRNLHFQVPLMYLKSMHVFDSDGNGNYVLEATCEGNNGVKVKEHDEGGGIVFSLKFTTYQIPLPKTTDVKRLQKNCGKLLKKLEKYKAYES